MANSASVPSTTCRSNAGRLMTLSTSAVAACCSRASVGSRAAPARGGVRDRQRFLRHLRYHYLPRSFRPRRTTVPSPPMVLQNKRVLSQSPVDVLGTMREAVEIRFFCLEATSLLCTAW